VIAIAIAVTAPLVNKGWYHRRVVIPASVAIASIGLYWTVTRLSA
jgi:hypothetical protein